MNHTSTHTLSIRKRDGLRVWLNNITGLVEADALVIAGLEARLLEGCAPAAFAAERCTYTQGGNTYPGWKHFYEDGTVVIRDLNNMLVVGATEVIATAPVVATPVVANRNEHQLITTATILTAYRSVTLVFRGGTVEVQMNGVTVTYSNTDPAITFTADVELLNNITVTPVTGTAVALTIK